MYRSDSGQAKNTVWKMDSWCTRLLYRFCKFWTQKKVTDCSFKVRVKSKCTIFILLAPIASLEVNNLFMQANPLKKKIVCLGNLLMVIWSFASTLEWHPFSDTSDWRLGQNIPNQTPPTVRLLRVRDERRSAKIKPLPLFNIPNTSLYWNEVGSNFQFTQTLKTFWSNWNKDKNKWNANIRFKKNLDKLVKLEMLPWQLTEKST